MQPSIYTLSKIYCYPIKSLGGVFLTKTKVLERGLEYDRRWLLIDDNGKFLTQRENAEMALLHLNITKTGLVVKHIQKDIEPCFIPFKFEGKGMITVEIWNDIFEAQLVDQSIDEWFSKALGHSCKLVYMPQESTRLVSPKHTKGATKTVSFADAFPYLILGQSALDNLNGQLDQPIPMNRFRPNFVFTGGTPNEEDIWRKIKIGSAIFYGVKACARCQVPTIDQNTGQKSKEPIRTLAKYRRKNNKIYFGENLIVDNFPQAVFVGDTIEVLETSVGIMEE